VEIVLLLGAFLLLDLLAWRFGADSRRPGDRGWWAARS
jgi:hypothetical protein